MSNGGDGILTVTGFGRFEKLHAEYNRLLERIAKLEAQLKKVKAASQEAEDQQVSSAEALGSKVESLAAKWFTATQALALYNSETERQKQLAQDAMNKSVSLAASQIELMSNMGARATPQERRGLVARVEAAAPRFGMQPEDAQRAASLISASVPGNNPKQREETMFELLRLASAFYAGDPANRDNIGQLGAAAGHLMKGVKDMTPDQATRIEAGLLAQSALENASKLPNVGMALVTAQNMSPGVLNQYENTKQAAAAVAALTQRMGDSQGELSRTAASNLFSVFRESDVGKKYSSMPILEAIKKANEDDPAFIQKTLPKLLGRSFSKSPQAEILTGGTTGVLSDIILGELSISDNQWEAYLKDLREGTPDIKRARTLQKGAAQSNAANTQRRADAGTVAAMLFGGEVGDQKIAGFLPATAHWGGASTSNFIQEQAYWAYVNAGVSPKEAAFHVMRQATQMSNIPGFGRWFGGAGRTEADLKILEEGMRTIKELPDVIQDNTNLTVTGQNSQNAAAQRNAQVE